MADVEPYSIEQPHPKETQPSLEHSDVTVVFGQGPVQEYEDGQGEKGRTGLNFFSRLNGLAAAEMLAQGKTEKVILSGGATGVKQEKTEAALLEDLITTNLILRAKQTEDKKSYQLTLGARTITVPYEEPQELAEDELERQKQLRTARSSMQERLRLSLKDIVQIEDRSKNTVENFVNVINDYIDADPTGNKTMTLLGIGFHAENTHSGADIGRLQKLANIFEIKGQVISAEEVLKQLVVDYRNKKSQNSGIASIMSRLSEVARDHDVAKGKSRQEGVLVELLDVGDWISGVKAMKNPDRLRSMLQKSPFALKIISKYKNISPDESSQLLQTLHGNELQDLVKDIDPLVKEDEEYRKLQETYGKVKGEVLNDFEQLRDRRIASMIESSDTLPESLELSKEELQRSEPSMILKKARGLLTEIENELVVINKKIANGDDNALQLINRQIELLTRREPLVQLVTEDKYETAKTYIMQYGKGDDPRKKTPKTE